MVPSIVTETWKCRYEDSSTTMTNHANSGIYEKNVDHYHNPSFVDSHGGSTTRHLQFTDAQAALRGVTYVLVSVGSPVRSSKRWVYQNPQ